MPMRSQFSFKADLEIEEINDIPLCDPGKKTSVLVSGKKESLQHSVGQITQNSRHHEPLLCAYLQFITIDIFMQNYFARLWILSDDMQKTNLIIEGSNKDPTARSRRPASRIRLVSHTRCRGSFLFGFRGRSDRVEGPRCSAHDVVAAMASMRSPESLDASS